MRGELFSKIRKNEHNELALESSAEVSVAAKDLEYLLTGYLYSYRHYINCRHGRPHDRYAQFFRSQPRRVVLGREEGERVVTPSLPVLYSYVRFVDEELKSV